MSEVQPNSEVLSELILKIAQRLYDSGMKWFESGDLEEALKCFHEISSVDQTTLSGAVFRDAFEKANQIEKQLEISGLYDKANFSLDNEDWQRAISIFEDIKNIRANYKDVEEKLTQARIQFTLISAYTEGVKYYRTDDWEEAINSFEKVAKIQPNYENVQTYLADAQEQLRKTKIYEDGKREYNQKHWEESIYWFKQIPKYRDADVLLADAELKKRLDALYKKGLAELHHEKWLSARKTFKKLEQLDPKYRDIDDLITRLEIKIKEEKNNKQNNRQKYINIDTIGFILGVLGILLSLGLAYYEFGYLPKLEPPDSGPVLVLTPTPSVLALEQCLGEADVTLAVKGDKDYVFSDGDTINIGLDPIDLELIIVSNCPEIEKIIIFQWNAIQGTISPNEKLPFRASYSPPIDSKVDLLSLQVSVSQNSKNKKQLSFFINISQ